MFAALQWHSTLSRSIGTSPYETSSWRLKCSQDLDRCASSPAFFDNQIASLELEVRSATITFEKGALDASRESYLDRLCESRLA
jgi:hypothetical protein